MTHSKHSSKSKSGKRVKDVSAEKKSQRAQADNLTSDKKTDSSIGQTQYPAKLHYHGSDDERLLNPEE